MGVICNLKTNMPIMRPLVLIVLGLITFVASVLAQEVSIPDPGLNDAIRAALRKPSGPLTDQDLLSLTNLDASNRNISSLEGLETARNLSTLGLFNNHLTGFTLPSGLANLTLLDLGFNALVECSIPDGLTNLDTLFLEGNLLTHFTLPAGLIRATKVDFSGNGLTSLTFPADMTNLVIVLAFANQLTNVTLPANLNKLGSLILDFNRLRSLDLPEGLMNLGRLTLSGSQLTNLTFPADMTNLTFLDVRNNRLADLTLPPGLTQLTSIFLDGNPLTSFVLSEPLAATNLAGTVTSLRNQGVAVFTYPLGVHLLSPLLTAGAFGFRITGPPGIYTVLSSSDLATWTELGAATNRLGSIAFTDRSLALSPQRFYRVRLGR